MVFTNDDGEGLELTLNLLVDGARLVVPDPILVKFVTEWKAEEELLMGLGREEILDEPVPDTGAAPVVS